MTDKNMGMADQNFETIVPDNPGAKKNPVILLKNLYSKNPKIFIAISGMVFVLILYIAAATFIPKKQRQNGTQNTNAPAGQTATGTQNSQPDIQENDLTKIEKAIKSDDLFESSLMPPILDMNVSF